MKKNLLENYKKLSLISQIKDDPINTKTEFQVSFKSTALQEAPSIVQMSGCKGQGDSVQAKQCVQQGQVWNLALRDRHALVGLLWLLLAILPRLLSHGTVKRHSLSPDRLPPPAQDALWLDTAESWKTTQASLFLWTSFIHISFLRYWQPALGLEGWRTFMLKIKATLMRQETAMVYTKPWKVLSALCTHMSLVS